MQGEREGQASRGGEAEHNWDRNRTEPENRRALEMKHRGASILCIPSPTLKLVRPCFLLTSKAGNICGYLGNDSRLEGDL